jgi:futalosine hydrolase
MLKVWKVPLSYLRGEQEYIPCIQLRAVSNYVEKRNKDAWNIPLAIENLNKQLIAIINDFN